jgi:hypothetical protein
MAIMNLYEIELSNGDGMVVTSRYVVARTAGAALDATLAIETMYHGAQVTMREEDVLIEP